MTALLGHMVPIAHHLDLNALLGEPRLTNPALILSADRREFQLVLKRNPYDRRRIWRSSDRNWNEILGVDGKLRVRHVHARLGRDFAVIESRPLRIPPLRLGSIDFDSADDVRIIEWNGRPRLMGSCLTVASAISGGTWHFQGMRTRMFMAPLDPADGAQPFVLPAFFNNAKFDKNWISHERNTGELALSIDFNRNIWLALPDAPTQPVAMPKHALTWQGGWSGSSSLVSLEEGFLAVLHRTVSISPAEYSHMFVICDRRFRVLRRSEPFTFEGEPVEFCMGLTRDRSTSQIFISYGLWDEAARIVTLAEGDVLSLCTHEVKDPGDLYAVM